MDMKIADEAVKWSRTILSKTGGRIPEWSEYVLFVKAKAGGGRKSSMTVPKEYHYAYLRLKGISHMDAIQRLDLSGTPQSEVAHRNKSWLKFW